MMTARSRATVRHALVTMVTGLSLAACAGNRPTAPGAPAEQITQLIGSAACSSDDDCATVGIGALACGGPQAYAAWSKKTTDAQALTRAVARHRAEREQQIAKTGAQSICMVVPDPGAQCTPPVAGSAAMGRCELRAPGSGGAGSLVR